MLCASFWAVFSNLQERSRQRFTKADLTAADTTRGNITVGEISIEVIVPHDLGGLRILGFGPDGSFYVIVEEVTVNGAIQVDQTVRHYNVAGKLLGVVQPTPCQ